ncbi:MAG: carboxypeptidase-like regulatory domain-containing protein [Kineosporiaceae bacterium]
MRLAGPVDVLEVTPGRSGEIPLEVVNTGTVIDGISARVLGLPAELATATPAMLPLFPDASGRVVVRLDLPPSFPAGRHPLVVEVQGSATGERAVHDVDLVVGPRPHLVLTASPRVVRARRRARFEVFAVNDGNLPLDVTLRATDSDRSLRCRITPSALTVAPGATAICEVEVRGPRHLLGGDVDRALDVEASVGGHDVPERDRRVSLLLRQAPALSRGLFTALVLLGIVGAWAAVFVFGLRTVLGPDKDVKEPAPSFFDWAQGTQGAQGSQAGGTAGNALGTAGGTTGGAAALVAQPLGCGGAPAVDAPAGSVPKGAALPAGVGGTLAGTVVAESDSLGVGRITVTAYRQARDCLLEVGSAATQGDGTYQIAGLFPGDYLLAFAAKGYRPLWYPDATAQAGARPVTVGAGEVAAVTDVVLAGLPATIRGQVDLGRITPGSAAASVTASVVARATWRPDDRPLRFPATVAADGSYTLANLPAPGTYEIAVTAQGYRPATLTERVVGGQTRFALTTTLGAGDGQIAGTVTDAGGTAIGGVQVATAIGDTPVVVGTPTVGTVGAFVIPGLPTPGTYVLTFTGAGFAPVTKAVDLAAGQVVEDLSVVLRGGGGTVTGRVQLADRSGVGGARVSGLGGPSTVATTTVTGPGRGTFVLAGLDPRTSSITVSLDGYLPASAPVDLSRGSVTGLTITLRPAVGHLGGRVLLPRSGQADVDRVDGLDVTATDGRAVRHAVAGDDGAPGGFSFDGLPPGAYTLSVTRNGTVLASAVAVVTTSGATRNVTLQLPTKGG